MEPAGSDRMQLALSHPRQTGRKLFQKAIYVYQIIGHDVSLFTWDYCEALSIPSNELRRSNEMISILPSIFTE